MSNPADDVSGEDGSEHWHVLTAEAYALYHEKLLSLRTHPGLTAYAVANRAAAASGTFAWHWGVDGEIRETINSINAWGDRLHSWKAWNLVVESHGMRTTSGRCSVTLWSR
jgi:N6-adenosine-specific RNA methylase IME4